MVAQRDEVLDSPYGLALDSWDTAVEAPVIVPNSQVVEAEVMGCMAAASEAAAVAEPTLVVAVVEEAE